jgi:hypothetical protein
MKFEGILDDMWKNEKETAPIMASPKRQKPQRNPVSVGYKRMKPKHKYPLLYKNSWNEKTELIDLGNHTVIDKKELQRAFNELIENGNVTIPNCEIPANQKLADHLIAFTKNLKVIEPWTVDLKGVNKNGK